MDIGNQIAKENWERFEKRVCACASIDDKECIRMRYGVPLSFLDREECEWDDSRCECACHDEYEDDGGDDW